MEQRGTTRNNHFLIIFSHTFFQILPHDTNDFQHASTIQSLRTFLQLIVDLYHNRTLQHLHIQICVRNCYEHIEYDPSMILEFILYLFPISPTLQHVFIHSVMTFRTHLAQVIFNNALNSIRYHFIPSRYIYSFTFPTQHVELHISFYNVTSNFEPSPAIRL